MKRLASMLLLLLGTAPALAQAPALFFTPVQRQALEAARAAQARVDCHFAGWLRTPRSAPTLWINEQPTPLPAGMRAAAQGKDLWLAPAQGRPHTRQPGDTWQSLGSCQP